MAIAKITDPQKMVTDPVLLSALGKKDIRPILGEIKECGRFKRIWQACNVCGKERWVIVNFGGVPRSFRCIPCANKELGVRKRGSKSSLWKGGTLLAHGYRRVYAPDHPKSDKNRYVLEHILVWEEAHNQPLPEGWIVHHINGTKTDNRPSNLLGMPRKKHHPFTFLKEVQERLRESEIENKQLRKALEDSQLIWPRITNAKSN